MILRILLTLWKPIAALLGAIGLYAKGRVDAKAKAALRAADEANEAHEVRNEVENRIARDRDARERLRERWRHDE
jgi:hypothetical protein